MKLFKALKLSQQGFVLPTVIGLMTIMAIVAYATLLQANNSLSLGQKQAYIQMARVASKAAVDYSQEQFDSAACGTYTGTAEQEIVSNSRYRVTFKSEVISTSADGYEKKIKGTGSVYLPKLSSTAKYVFDIRSEIIRTYALCKTPIDFGPKVWLDASDTTTLKKTITSQSASGTTGLGPLDLLLPNDTVEEKVTDGTQGLLSWLSNDLEAHTCDGVEYAVLLCLTAGQKDLYDGVIFHGVNIPKNSTVSSAVIQFTGAADPGGTVTHRTYGLYDTASNPHLGYFTSTGSNQVKNRITNATLRTSALKDVTTNNLPNGNTVNFDVTNIVQEMVNNANWDPTNHNGQIGFGIQRQSGTGARRFQKNGIQLSVTYTPTTLYQANNGDSLTEWQDKSGNGNNARVAYGTSPTRQDNQINSKTVVRFANGNMLSALTAALTAKREMTVLAVVKSAFSTSATDGRIISGMSSSGTNDTSGSDGIIPLLRYGLNSGFSNNYSGSGSTNRTDYTCGGTCANTTYLFTSSFAIDPTPNKIIATLKGNGTSVGTKNNISPATGSPPYTYTINQFYYGGRRNGSMAAGTGADYFNGDFAELVIYDKILSCREIEALEEYFRSKWAVSASAYSTTCDDSAIPTL